MQRELPEETNRKRLLRWLPYIVIAAVIAFYMLRRQHVVVELEGDQVARYLPGLPHWDTASTFRTTNIVVENQEQVGPTAPNPNERIFASSADPSVTVLDWHSMTGTGHTGTGGNNEAIPLGLRVNVGFAMGVGGTAVGRAIDLDAACSKSSGTGTLDCEGILIGVAGGDTNNAIHVLTGGVLVASTQGVAITAGPTSTIDLTATGTITANKATGTALSVPLADFNLAQNGAIGTNSTSTLALNSSVTTDVIMSNTAADQIFRMTNGSAGGHNYGLDNGGTAGFFGATLTLYDNTASRIAWQIADATGNMTITNAASIGGALDMTSHLINNVTDPVSAQDAATKNYVDTHTGSTTNRNPFAGIGTDGTCAFNGVTTPVCGATLSGSTYTLGRTVEAATMTVANGVTIKVAGYPINCTGTITGTGTATISGRGNDGSGITAGARSTVGSTFYPFSSNAGGNGGVTGASGAGGAGQSQGAAINEWPVCTTAHNTSSTSPGCGGGGGDGAGVGGAGGDSTPTGAARGGSTIQTLVNGRDAASNNLFSAAAGGGGGGASGGTCIAGGGGGGGAWVVVNAGAFAGSLTITAAGGNGAAATAGTGNCGGGGGGAGGVVAVTYETASGLTTTAAKGTGGAPTNAGNTGGNGFDGTVFRLNLSGDGT